MPTKHAGRGRGATWIFILLVAPAICAQVAEPPALVLQAGHTSTINSVAFSANGQTFLTASDDHTVKLWDARSGRVIRVFDGHTQGVDRALFSPDGQIIFSAVSDRKVQMWDVATGRAVRPYETDEKYEGSSFDGSIALSADGKVIIASYDKTYVWDVASGRRLHTIDRRLSALTFSPDGKAVAGVFNEKPTVQLFSPQTGELLRELPANPDALHQPLAFSPDATLLAVITRDSTVDLWHWAKSYVVRSFKDERYVDPPAVAFSPDGQLLLISNAPGRALIKKYLDLYEVRAGKLFRRIDVSNVPQAADAFQANAVAFHPDGKTFLTAGYIRLWQWDVAGGTFLRAYETAVEKESMLAIDGNRKNVLTGVQNVGAKLWDANFSARSVLADSDGFDKFYFSPDGHLVVTNNTSNYYLSFWQADSGQKVGRIEESTRQLLFSPDSQAFAVLKDDSAIHIYDSQTIKLARTLRGHTQDVTQVLFTPDGKLLASISEDKSAKLWDWRTGELLHTLSLENLTGVPTSLAFSPDGSTVAVAVGGGNVTLWDATTGQLKRSWSAGQASWYRVAFSPDGRTLATAAEKQKTQLWDVASGQLQRALGGEPGRDFMMMLAFSPDGQGLVAREGHESQGRHVVRLWNVTSGQLVLEWGGAKYDLEVRDVSFTKDGKALLLVADLQAGASNARDTATRIYATATGELLATVIPFADGSWVVVTPDGLFDGTPASWARLNWRFGATSVAPVEAFFNEFYYPGLLAELLSGKRPAAPRNIAQIDRRRPEVALSYAGQSSSESVTARSVKLTLTVSEDPPTPGGGAQDVRLFHNGALVKVFRGDVLKGQKSVTLEAAVPVVAGANQFTAYAFNRDNVKSDDAVLRLQGDAALARKGVAYVLVIGLNVYANPQFNLRYAVADAQAFGAEFQQQQSRLAQFAEVKVTALLDVQATKANILQQLARLAGQTQPEDAVVIFYAGHGLSVQNQFYVIPHDLGFTGRRVAVDAAGLQLLLAHSISDRELEQAFEPLNAGHLLLVLDACDSGQAIESTEKRFGPINSKGLAQLAYEKGMYILTAAQSFQAAQEAAQLGHGLLTYALVEEGLKRAAADDEPKDGQIVVREWLDYATSRVPVIQIDKMKAARGLGLNLSFSEDERGLDVEQRAGQRPRVFYRRELEAQPLVVVRP